jgi:Flp pilus assembly protein TadD
MKSRSPAAHAQLRRCSEILGRRPDDADAWHDLGIALLALGNSAGACAALRHALRLDAGRVGTCLALGRLLFDCGWSEAAMDLFDRATLRTGRAG